MTGKIDKNNKLFFFNLLFDHLRSFKSFVGGSMIADNSAFANSQPNQSTIDDPVDRLEKMNQNDR
jgi:hypothetical protein